MIVNSQNIEFGYELISVLPYAYYLHSKGELDKTISGYDTKCLYYFSPEHEINPAQRSWYNTSKAANIPNIDIHKSFLRKDKFLPPPLKKKYANNEFKFDKEIVIICNRYNIEWGRKPINYFSIDTLKSLFELLQDNYQIIYINIEGIPELYDNAPPMPLGDFKLLKRYPKVINLHEFKKKYNYTFNEIQLRLFANCDKFITMNGGHAILASYFGGENIIMSKYGRPQARELNEHVNSFYRWYNEFGDQRVRHVSNEKKLLELIKFQWIHKKPVVNILIRTSKRPVYFKNCIDSILNQTYKNVNIFVSNDTNDKYVVKYPVYPVHVVKHANIKPITNNESYGVPFPSNEYFNEMHKHVKEGLIIYLDDDDMFSGRDSLEIIVSEYEKGNNLILWRIKSKDRIIPAQHHWRKPPVCCDFSGISFAFDAKYKKHAKWEPYKRGDYRVGTKLYNKIKKKSYIDNILTQTQNGQNAGAQKDWYKIIDNIKREWYVTQEGGFWYGDVRIGNKKTKQGKMRLAKQEEIPDKLKK